MNCAYKGLVTLSLVLLTGGITLAFAYEDELESSPVVKTLQGSVEGVVLKSRNGNTYYGFKGVPYAKYPGRFEVAKEHAEWDGILSAKQFGSTCAQVDLFNGKVLGEESCLVLNIWTPSLDTGAKLPVLFFIHGGGYMSFNGDAWDGKYFVDENVIVVSINYRLGPLGFLTFEDDTISGNIGLKDQLMALKWVNKNIHFFGGDPTKVTVGGYSAGASAAHLHVLSPQTKDLFRAAISNSGSALSKWAIQDNPRENAVKIASFLDCPVPETRTSSTEETVACLKSKPMADLVEAQLQLRKWLGYPIVLFGPVVEQDKENGFIIQYPEESLMQGNYNQVPWISGFTEEEGALWDLLFIHNETLTEELDNNWELRAPQIFGYDDLPSSERDKISNAIRDAYFGRVEIGEYTWTSLRNLFTDRFFGEPCDAAVRLQSKYSPVFPYVFRFSGDYSYSHYVYGLEGDQGVCHGDDLIYLFPGGGGIGSPDYSGDTPFEIVDFSRKFVKLWASFIHETVPTATWKNEKVWKAMVELKDDEPVTYYEIAIETGIWNEDYSSRIKSLRRSFPRLSDKTKNNGKTEL